MAELHAPPPKSTASFLQKIRDHAPHSTRLTGLATLAISSAILLLLCGVTLTATILGFILFLPFILISSPIWIPLAAIFIVSATVFGFSAFIAAALSWLYRYFTNPEEGTAKHGNDPYGDFFLQSKAKDAAPGA